MPKKEKKGLVPSQIRETDTPSRRLSLSDLARMQGSSGTYIVHGFLETDYNTDLAGIKGLEKYDEMRKSDAQVNAILDAMGLPIRSTEWRIEAGTNEEGETDDLCEEMRQFVEDALFRKLEQAWDDHLREVLTFLPFGFCAKEKVYTAGDDGRIWLRTLAYRKQTTIYKWEQQDGSAGITQILPTPTRGDDGKLNSWVSVPASKILLFTFKREGDNYAGVSVLRSAYRHWYTKDLLYKFDAIKHERQSVGVPYMKLPSKATTEDKETAIQILKDLRANEQTGIVVPDGWEFGFAELKATDTSDIWKSIEHHNQQIAKNVLAMFMEIVGGEQGSRALSEDQSDFFLLALEAVAKQIDDVHSRFLIPELVDLNFDVPSATYYPRLAHRKLGSVDYSTISTVLSTLVSAGLITVDDPLEEWTRKLLDLPERVIEAPEEGMVDEMGNPIDPETGELLPPDEGAPEAALDEEGNPITDDEGAPLDVDGNPMPPEEEPMLDEEGNPIEPEEDELDDEDNADLDALEGELADVEVTDEDIAEAEAEDEGGEVPEEEMMKKKRGKRMVPFVDVEGKRYVLLGRAFCEVEGSVVFRRPMSAETKKKISEALKEKVGGDAEENMRKGVAGRKARRMQSLTQRSLRTPKASPSAARAPTGAQRLAQQRKDPNSPLYKGKKAINKQRGASSPKKKGTKKAKVSLIKQALADAKKNAKSNPKVLARLKARIQKLRPAKKAPPAAKASKAPSGAPKKKQAGVKAGEDKERRAAPFQANAGHTHGDTTVQAVYEGYLTCCDFEQIIAIQNSVERDPADAEPRARPWQFNEIEAMSWRPLTFAEKKVNFSSLKKALAAAAGRFDTDIESITSKQKADILAQVKRAVEGNDIAKVGQIKAKYTGDLAAALTSIQQDMFEVGKKSVAAEISVKVPPTAKEIAGALRVQNDKIVDKFVTDMEAAASTAVSQTVAKHGGAITSTGTTEAVNAAAEAIEKAVTQGKAAMNTLSVIGTLNLGRATIFERYPEEVSAMQYSAIIDDRTTDMCLALDGRVVKPGSAEFYQYSPPRHYNCRSIWVEILRDEEFQPEETGIPKSIPANAVIDTFEDLKAPIVLPKSPAIKIIKEEIDERKAKIEEYKAAGSHQNRIDAHQARVDALEQSLEDLPRDDDSK